MLIILSILNLICFIVILLLEAKSKEQRAQLDGGILDYSITMRFISVLGFFLCAFIDYQILSGSQDKFIRYYSLTETIVVFIFTQIIIPFSAYFLFFESFFTNIKYSSTGIILHSVWKGTRSLGWSDIKMVTFANSLKGSRLYLIDTYCHQYRISAEYREFGSFVSYLKIHLLPEVVANSESALELAREFAISNRGNSI